MEISASKLLPYLPATPGIKRDETDPSFKQQAKGEVEEVSAEHLPRRQSGPDNTDAQLDYRQLLIQARQQRAQGEQGSDRERGAFRLGQEPHPVQRALGAYRDNAAWQEEGGELMPRLDDFA